jgi:hypothetical protein
MLGTLWEKINYAPEVKAQIYREKTSRMSTLSCGNTGVFG